MYENDNNNDENEDEYRPLLSKPEYNASQAFEKGNKHMHFIMAMKNCQTL